MRLLLLLAQEDHAATVRACLVAAQGQVWRPNMFIMSLQKRHQDNEELRGLAADLLHLFSLDMPIESPVQLLRADADAQGSPTNSKARASSADPTALGRSPPRDSLMLPSIARQANGSPRSPMRSPFSPMTTISAYNGMSSPYSPTTRLPLTRPPTSPGEQSRRSVIYSTPKLEAVDGERRRRCRTPYITERAPKDPNAVLESPDGALDPLSFSPPSSPGPSSQKKKVVLSEKYSWNPECINSVSGFEWWWRSLPQHHASLEPTQKLKAVTKAAVRLHTKGDLSRAIELYELALASAVNDEVQFRLRINLACALEASNELSRSVEEFRRAVALNPDDAYAKFKLGDVLAATSAFDEARQLYQSILDVYPQAADALTALDRAEMEQRAKDAAHQEAVAAAKTRRSPAKNGGQDGVSATGSSVDTTPTPPSTSKSGNRSSAPRSTRSHRRAEENPQAIDATEAGETLRSSVSVATLTDPAQPTQDGLAEVLARRCRELRVDLADYFRRMDPHGSGVVRRVTAAAMIRLIAGTSIANLSDEQIQLQLGALLGDGDETNGKPGYLVYENLLATHATRMQTLAEVPSESEASRVAAMLEALVGAEAASPSGSDDAIANGEEKTAAEHILETDGPRAEDVVAIEDDAVDGDADSLSVSNADTSEESPVQDHEAREIGHSHSHPPLADTKAPSTRSLEETTHLEHSAVVATSADGYTALSPRVGDKRERAREEQILRAEKARVLARKHMHCLKSLRDIAAHARKHRAARRAAREGLVQIARDAHVSLAEQRQQAMDTALQPPTTSIDEPSGDDAEPTTATTAAELHAAWAGTALRRVQLARDLEELQALARQFASHCRVPPDLAA